MACGRYVESSRVPKSNHVLYYADELNTAMDGRMTAADGKLTTLQGDEKTEGSVKKALADAKGYADGLNSDMDTRVKAVEEAVTVGTF